MAVFDHIVCCDPDTALCGADVAGEDISLSTPDHAPNLCPNCRELAALSATCSEPSCLGVLLDD
jgi:hypothetical protein